MSLSRTFVAGIFSAFFVIAAVSLPHLALAEAGSVGYQSATQLGSVESQKAANDKKAQAAKETDSTKKAELQANAQASQAQANAAGNEANRSLQAQQPSAKSSVSGCDISGVSDIGVCIVKGVGSAILGFSNFFLGLAGVLLNWTIVTTVFQFGNLIGNSPGMLIAWGVMRDIGNLILLFGFIYMGLMTIINAESYSSRKAISQLLIFAVLMNFSLFAAEAIIDVSNGLSSALYSQMNTSCVEKTSLITAFTGNDCLNLGIAGSIMRSTGLSGMLDVKVDSLGNISQLVVGYLGLALFASIGAIVFFAATIMLAIRLVYLSFLMIVSPIGFAGMAVPQFQDFAKKWWKTLIDQSFFAPVLFLLIYISLRVTDSFASVAPERSLANAIMNPQSSSMAIVMMFLLIIGFLVFSLIAAKSMGAQGAQGAINFSTKIVRGSYGRVGGAITGRIGRDVIAPRFENAQKSYEKRFQNSSGALQKFMITSGLDDAARSALEAGKNSKYGGSVSRAERQKKIDTRTKEADKAKKDEQLKNDVTSIDPKNNTADQEMSDMLKKLTESQILELNEVKEGTGNTALLAKNLSPEMFEKIMTNKEVSDANKEKLRNGRFAEIASRVAAVEAAEIPLNQNTDPANEATLKAKLSAEQQKLRVATKDISTRDAGQLAQSTAYQQLYKDPTFVRNINDDQAKEAKRVMSPTQRKQLDETRFSPDLISNFSPAEIGNIPGMYLANPLVLEKMTARQWGAINPDKLESDEAKVVIDYIKDQVQKNTKNGEDFRNYYTGNAKIRNRWSEYEVVS
jgi:hypothetical protein